MSFRLVIAALVGTAVTSLASPAAGLAATGDVKEFPLSTANSQPFGITKGPDGNVWFAEKGAGTPKPIGRIASDGTITEFPTAAGSTPYDITVGPDGNLWFTDQGLNQVGRITPSGNYTGFGGLGLVTPRGIATGPDGHIYVVDANAVAPEIMELKDDGTKVKDIPIPTTASNPQFIARGPDGNMWFTEFSDPGKVGRVNLGNNPKDITEFTVGKSLLGVAAGADGKVYFTEASGTPKISRINPDGTGYESTPQLATGTSDPEGLAVGSDGNLYVAIFNGSQIGQITPNLGLQQFGSGITANSGPRLIATGADGNVWFTEETGNAIGRMTVEKPAPPSTGTGSTTAGGTDAMAPGLKRVVANAKRVKFTLSEDASVKVKVARVTRVRRSHRSDAAAARSRTKTVRTLTVAGKPGRNTVSLRTRGLAAGSYRVTVRAIDAAGNASKPAKASFKVKRPRR
jgi:virginiamycin B lyase